MSGVDQGLTDAQAAELLRETYVIQTVAPSEDFASAERTAEIERYLAKWGARVFIQNAVLVAMRLTRSADIVEHRPGVHVAFPRDILELKLGWADPRVAAAVLDLCEQYYDDPQSDDTGAGIFGPLMAAGDGEQAFAALLVCTVEAGLLQVRFDPSVDTFEELVQQEALEFNIALDEILDQDDTDPDKEQ